MTISAAGSYRLTSNPTVPDENTDCITVDSDDVGIDLNNFTIRGPEHEGHPTSHRRASSRPETPSEGAT